MSKAYRQESAGSLSVPAVVSVFGVTDSSSESTPHSQPPSNLQTGRVVSNSIAVQRSSDQSGDRLEIALPQVGHESNEPAVEGTVSASAPIGATEILNEGGDLSRSSSLRNLADRRATASAERLTSEAWTIPLFDESFGYRLVKRLLDIVGASIGLLLLGPLMGLCAILIKFQDGGPILFRQVRVGKRGERFEIVKFRSMVVNAEELQSDLKDLNEHDDHRTFKILNDPRITRVGRFMRRMSLDELPQLWNVLCGEMTLVGPRPALPKEVEMYDAEHMVRLAVKPGLTCIWQVSGRSNLGFQRQIELDLDYIRQRNIWLDVRLIVRTVPAVVIGNGAA
jgi:lipopolysaccharide/colanic/teichoic acid biosynthesis glycosyltransferase